MTAGATKQETQRQEERSQSGGGVIKLVGGGPGGGAQGEPGQGSCLQPDTCHHSLDTPGRDRGDHPSGTVTYSAMHAGPFLWVVTMGVL